MIELLVDRLRWPAALVRERAASQIGKLIADGDQGARDALIAWIARQELESLAAIGLLPFLHAVAKEGAKPPATAELASACKARSALSELYLSHLDPTYVSRPELGRHSGSPPSGWQAPDKVPGAPTSRLEASLPGRLLQLAERRFRRSLSRQFDFEMSILGELHGASPARAFRATGTSEDGYHPGWHPLSIEVCLSAYLRTLAWAASNESCPNDLILKEAAFVSPIDLGLWRVRSTVSPDWWPSLEISSDRGEVDKDTVAILQNVESAVELWGAGSNVVLAASGCLSQTSLVQHDLRVRSFFQQPDGPDRPTSQELFECLCSVRASVHQEPSPLWFEGSVTIDTKLQRLADWLIVPCSGSTHPAAFIIWQTWRGLRQIQCPSEALAVSELHALCREDSIDYESGEGLIAQWRDWSRGVSALAVKGLMPASGWVLVAPRAVVERFSETTGMELAWAWEIASHFREDPFRDFVEHRMYGDRGTSRVIRP